MPSHEEATAVDPRNSQSDDADAGCTVDWSWIHGLQVESATSDLKHWRVRFTNGLTLTVQAAMYQGAPFLAFDPYKPRDA
ncbi:MAG: hypothetical protein U0821_01470 [Chloroflexota bacterium]